MKQLIQDHVHKEIKNGNIITASQHDFMQNRLSQTNCIELSRDKNFDFFDLFNKGNYVDKTMSFRLLLSNDSTWHPD